ncbi:MAG: hypothetical protein EAZ44_09215 [Cytophagia bacterium]|nr:MAG: hypothetical protein EAZ44_09215 [Cytophagia bacterium]TAG41733.1 MAG: hypothetical protein EAZ31_07155 [Cytophagia bacterium]
MENLVTLEGKKALTTSLKIAETFGKDHKNVLRDITKTIQDLEEIENMNSEKDRLKFEPIFYEDNYGRKQKAYLLNKDAFSMIVMSYTTPSALKFKLAFINAFNQMEEHIRTLGKSLLTTKEIALIHQMLVFFKYLDNCQKVEKLHQKMFVGSFYGDGKQRDYGDLVKMFHNMRNKLLNIGNTQKIKELYKQNYIQNPQGTYNKNANKFLMIFTIDKYECIRHAVADFLKLQLCEDTYTLKIATEAKNVAKEASIELEKTNEETLFHKKEEEIINLSELKKLATALLQMEMMEE